MRDEDEFLRVKGSSPMHDAQPYKNAPGTEEVDGEMLNHLADTLRDISVTGMVRREQVAPYINNFPIHVGLEDFDEKPSTRNHAVALESMAAYLKMGLALAMIGVIGFVVFNLVTSRNKVATITGEEGWRAWLFQQIARAQSILRTSPVWLKRDLVGEDGLNLPNSIVEMFRSDPDLDLSLEKEGARMFSQMLYGRLPSFCHLSNVSSIVEMVAQKKTIEQLGKILDGAGERIQHGQASEVIREIEELCNIQPIKRLVDSLEITTSKVVGHVSRKPGQSDAEYLVAIMDKVEELYGSVEDDGENVKEAIRTNITNIEVLHLPYPSSDGSMVGNLSLTDSTLKGAVEAMDKLKRQARGYKLSSEVEEAAGEAIRNLDMITKAGTRMYDVASAEVTSAFRHARWLAGVYVKILAKAEAILTHNNESAGARKLAEVRKELEQTLKKSL